MWIAISHVVSFLLERFSDVIRYNLFICFLLSSAIIHLPRPGRFIAIDLATIKPISLFLLINASRLEVLKLLAREIEML